MTGFDTRFILIPLRDYMLILILIFFGQSCNAVCAVNAPLTEIYGAERVKFPRAMAC